MASITESNLESLSNLTSEAVVSFAAEMVVIHVSLPKQPKVNFLGYFVKGTVGSMPCTHLPDWPFGASVALQTFLVLTLASYSHSASPSAH